MSYNAYAGWTIAHETGDLIEMATSRPVAAYIEAVGSHPSIGSWIEQFGKKLKGAFHGVEWSSNENFYNMQRFAPSLRLGLLDMFTLIPLGILGLWLAIRMRIPHGPIVLALVFHVSLLVGLCVTGRYRVPVAPLLLVYTSGVVAALASPILDGRFPNVVLLIACTTALVFGRSAMNRQPEDEYRVSEYILLYNAAYVPRLQESADRKEWETCAEVLEQFLEFMPEAFMQPDKASTISTTSKSTMTFFGGLYKRLSQIHENAGRSANAARAKKTALGLEKAAGGF